MNKLSTKESGQETNLSVSADKSCKNVDNVKPDAETDLKTVRGEMERDCHDKRVEDEDVLQSGVVEKVEDSNDSTEGEDSIEDSIEDSDYSEDEDDDEDGACRSDNDWYEYMGDVVMPDGRVDRHINVYGPFLEYKSQLLNRHGRRYVKGVYYNNAVPIRSLRMHYEQQLCNKLRDIDDLHDGRYNYVISLYKPRSVFNRTLV